MKSRNLPEFPLHNAVLMMALAAAYPLSAAIAAPAGIAQFAVGDVNVRRVDGRAEALVKGKDIESGQAIVTGANGRAQVRFSDGGLISLQPNTEFKVTNYVDKADPKEDRFLVDLLRGSMRAITGLIGKRNRENYKVMTTTATIGIRGSGFNAGYNPDGTLGVTTELDAIEVCNAAGCVGLTAGESVLVVSNQTLPVRTNTRADVPTPETKQDEVVAGNQVDKSGSSAIVPPPAPAPAPAPRPAPAPPAPPAPKLLTGVGFTSISLVSNDSTVTGYETRSSINGTLVVGESSNVNQPTSYISNDASIGTGTGTGTKTVIASSGSLANGDYMVLGTWEGVKWVTLQNGSVAFQQTAFAAGVASPVTAFKQGVRGTYSLKNATPVFSSIGASGTLLSSSKLTADFTDAYVDVNLDVRMSGTVGYNLRGGVTAIDKGIFSGSLAVSGSGCQGATAFCDYGTVAGYFVGSTAQNAVLSFGAGSAASGAFAGAATFSSTAQTTTPVNNSLTDISIRLTDGSEIVSGYSYSSYPNYITVTPSFNGQKLNGLTSVDSYQTTKIKNADPALVATYGALGTVTDKDFIGWGKWAVGSKEVTSTYGYSATSTQLDSVHYLAGRPTSAMPTTGVGTYTMVGGTSPTATLNGATTSGRLVSADLTADFAVGRVVTNINTQFGATPVNLTNHVAGMSGSSFGTYMGNTNALVATSSTSGTSVTGFFTGDKATRAGLVYTIPGTQVGTVTGAVAFQQANLSPSQPR